MKSSPKKLKVDEISKKLKKISDWHLNTKQTELSKKFEFPSFVNGLAFVAKIAVHAEVLGHHPVVELSANTVKVTVTTHDVKGLTNMDFDLVKRIDNLRLA